MKPNCPVCDGYGFLKTELSEKAVEKLKNSNDYSYLFMGKIEKVGRIENLHPDTALCHP